MGCSFVVGRASVQWISSRFVWSLQVGVDVHRGVVDGGIPIEGTIEAVPAMKAGGRRDCFDWSHQQVNPHVLCGRTIER